MDANFFAPNVLKTEILEITKYTVVLDSTITTNWVLVLDLSHGSRVRCTCYSEMTEFRNFHFEDSTS